MIDKEGLVTDYCEQCDSNIKRAFLEESGGVTLTCTKCENVESYAPQPAQDGLKTIPLDLKANE